MEKVHIGGASRRGLSRSQGTATPRRGSDAPAKPRSVQDIVRERKQAANAKARDQATVRREMTIRARKAKSVTAKTTRRREVVKTKAVETAQKKVVKAREQLAKRIAAKKRQAPAKKTVRAKKTSGDERARKATERLSTLGSKQRNAVKIKDNRKKAARIQKRKDAQQRAKDFQLKRANEAKALNKDDMGAEGRGSATDNLSKGGDGVKAATVRSSKADADGSAAAAAARNRAEALDPVSKAPRKAEADEAVGHAGNKLQTLKNEATPGPTPKPVDSTPERGNVDNANKAAAEAAGALGGRKRAQEEANAKATTARNKADAANDGIKDARRNLDDAVIRSKTTDPTPPKAPNPPGKKNLKEAEANAAKVEGDVKNNTKTRDDLNANRKAAEEALQKAKAADRPDVPGAKAKRDAADAAATKAKADKDAADAAAAKAKAARDAADADLKKNSPPKQKDPKAEADLKAARDRAAKLEAEAAKARGDKKDDPTPPKKKSDDDDAAAAAKKKKDREDEEARAKKEREDKEKDAEANRKRLDESRARMRSRGLNIGILLLGFFPLLAIFGGKFSPIPLPTLTPPKRFPIGIFAPRSGGTPYSTGLNDGGKDGYAEGYVNGTSDRLGQKSATDSGLRDVIQILEMIQAKKVSGTFSLEHDAFCAIKRPLVISGSLVMSEVYPQCRTSGGSASGPSGPAASGSGASGSGPSGSGPSGPRIDLSGYTDGYREGFISKYPLGYNAGVVSIEKKKELVKPIGYGAYGASDPYGGPTSQIGGEGPGTRVEQRGATLPAVEDDEDLSETLLTPKDFLYLLSHNKTPKSELRFIERYMSQAANRAQKA